MSTINEDVKEIPIVEEADVIVCGGGPAGVTAAIMAARTGAKTCLIDVGGCLGGTWTAGLLTFIIHLDQPGFSMELTDELDKRNARIPGNEHWFAYNPEKMKLLLEEMCLDENIRIRLHTRVVGAQVDESNRLRYIITESKSGRQAWGGKVFIDATGDGDVGAFAGCGFDMGSEEGELQPLTMMGYIVVKDVEAVKDYVSFYNGATTHESWHWELLNEQILKAGETPTYGKPTLFQVQDGLIAIMVNHEYRVSAIDADQMTDATIRSRKDVYRIVQALEKMGGPWKGVQLAATAEHIGIREGRRIHGLYTLNKDDLINGTQHEDAVAVNTFCVDIHSPDSKKSTKGKEHGIKVKPHTIPYRSLIAKDVDGLMMAGRCISGDWYAHASYRITGKCVPMGEAAGTAAALAVKNDVLPQDVAWDDIRLAMNK